MNISVSDNINLCTKTNLNELEREYDRLYSQALILSTDPENQRYIDIKKELWSIYFKIDEIIRG